jgi:adenylate cyclase
MNETAPLFAHSPPPGLEPLALGIGIETGSALIGSFGPARRRTHTVLGETVTVAVRLQALTVDLAQPIVVGEHSARRLPKDALISLGSFLLEGLRTPREVYAPPGGEGAVPRRESRSGPRPRLISGLRKG